MTHVARRRRRRIPRGWLFPLGVVVAILVAGLWLFTQTPFGSDLMSDITRQIVNAGRDLMSTITSWAKS